MPIIILLLSISFIIILFSIMIFLQYKGKINFEFLQTIDFYVSNYKTAKIIWFCVTFLSIGFALFWSLALGILIMIA